MSATLLENIGKVLDRHHQPRPREWTLHEYDEVDSTNLIAATLSAWNAVRAETQSAGRGRFQRRWVSDAGGLWLSAVVPVDRHSNAWRMLPLITGLAVCDALRDCGVPRLRMRWPNDVLVDDAKLAGLLIDQFSPGLAVVGIGVNVSNRPDMCDTALRGHVARLEDFAPALPSLHTLSMQMLNTLKLLWQSARANQISELLCRVNDLWDLPRRVALDLDGEHIEGQFTGVDETGRLHLCLPDKSERFFEPHQVRMLRDLK
jgi:BirA family biotin operon repressor/biotin-[acetyl-CoA-carboxylase] ligase